MTQRQRLFSTIILTILILLTHSAYADRLIIEPDMGRDPILSSMGNARQSLHLVMYGFTDQTLLDELLKQKQQGRSIKVILERSPYKANDENTRVIRAFNLNNVDWKGSIPDIKLIHQKTLIVDNKQALVMTFNFTRSAFDANASHPARNFALVVDDAKTVKDIDAIFSADWNQIPAHYTSNALLYSPSNSRSGLLNLIDHAQNNIKMYAQDISDYKMIGACASAAKRGARVEILLAKLPSANQIGYLQRAGVLIATSKQYYIHAKALVIDNKMAVIGSINLTSASLDSNRELSVISKDPAVIKALSNTFEQDWQNANNSVTKKSQRQLAITTSHQTI